MSSDPPFDPGEPASISVASLQALLVVSPGGRIQFATGQARLWIKEFFATTRRLGHLPTALHHWLDDEISGKEVPRFVVGQSGRRLFVRLLFREKDSVCLLLERSPGTSAILRGSRALTGRQVEVLTWVARGKTNAEIAKLLNLKPKTVGKYLERIYPKLGVENRTAAASFILGTDIAK
jgi:DNA-binding CsgD family transcriptional regulator